jgi:hypothetical protein
MAVIILYPPREREYNRRDTITMKHKSARWQLENGTHMYERLQHIHCLRCVMMDAVSTVDHPAAVSPLLLIPYHRFAGSRAHSWIA